MTDRPNRLTAAFVKKVTEPGRYGDGRGGYGLSLLVKVGAGGRVLKSFSQRIRIHGRPTNLGLGPFPVVTLAEARRQALHNQRMVFRGRDPRTGDTNREPTFAEAYEKVIEVRRKSWKPGGRSETNWRSAFERHVLPIIGRKPVGGVTPADVYRIVTAGDMWNQRRASAKRLLMWCGVVFKWAVANGYRDADPVPAIRTSLPTNGVKTKHQRAIPHGEVSAAIEAVRMTGARDATKLAFEFMVATATRSGEARLARWSEIDGDTWTIPAARMKAGREHRVALSARALDVLREAKRLRKGDTIFTGRGGGAVSQKAISEVVRLAGVKAVPHGFRTSFRTWCGDTGVDRELAERALAHTVRNQAEAAYARGDLLERRRAVMEDWGRYCDPS